MPLTVTAVSTGAVPVLMRTETSAPMVAPPPLPAAILPLKTPTGLASMMKAPRAPSMLMPEAPPTEPETLLKPSAILVAPVLTTVATLTRKSPLSTTPEAPPTVTEKEASSTAKNGPAWILPPVVLSGSSASTEVVLMAKEKVPLLPKASWLLGRLKVGTPPVSRPTMPAAVSEKAPSQPEACTMPPRLKPTPVKASLTEPSPATSMVRVVASSRTAGAVAGLSPPMPTRILVLAGVRAATVTETFGVLPVAAVSKATVAAPSIAMPGTSTCRLAPRLPETLPAALVVAGLMTRLPAMLVALTRLPPRESEPLLISIRVCGGVAGLESWSTCLMTRLAVSSKPATPITTLVPVIRSVSPALSSRVVVVVPIVKACRTSVPVLLISTPRVPVSVTPGTPTRATVPEMRPAILALAPVPSTTTRASPPVTFRTVRVPSPMLSSAPVTAIRMTWLAGTAGAESSCGVAGLSARAGSALVVICSISRLPFSDCPATLRVTPVASTRRYGPAGSCTETWPLPTVRVWLTAAEVVLTASETPAENSTCGMLRLICPASRPATPAGVITKRPVRPETTTTASAGLLPPSRTLPSARPTRTTRAPVALVTCSKVTSAVMTWPRTVRLRSSPRTTSLGEAGLVSISMATLPLTLTPGTATESWTEIDPVIPAVPKTKLPVVPGVWVTLSSGAAAVPPSFSAALRSRSVVVGPTSSSSKSACRLWPAMLRVTAVPVTAR